MTTFPARRVRLRDGRLIAATLRSRQRRAGSLLAVHGRVRAGDQVALGFVASKRVGNAVRRNRAKRLLREASRQVPWAPGLEVVLVARPSAADASMDQVYTELRSLAGRAGLLADAAVSA